MEAFKTNSETVKDSLSLINRYMLETQFRLNNIQAYLEKSKVEFPKPEIDRPPIEPIEVSVNNGEELEPEKEPTMKGQIISAIKQSF